MSKWTAIIFDDPDQAGKVRETLRGLERDNRLKVNDSAVIVRDAEGNVHVKGQADSGTKWGALGGALIGGLLVLMFPIAGMVGGAVVGGLMGRMAGKAIDKRFVEDVKNALQPGNSGIILVTSGGDPEALRAVIEPYQGKIFSTSLDPDQEEQLKRALE